MASRNYFSKRKNAKPTKARVKPTPKATPKPRAAKPREPEPIYLCAGDCGYPVSDAGELCGECACEQDGDIW